MGRFLVDLQLMVVGGGFPVAVWGLGADKLTVTLLGRKGGAGFSGDVFAVSLIYHVLQRNNIAILGAFRSSGMTR